jgi:hypothetical protein
MISSRLLADGAGRSSIPLRSEAFRKLRKGEYSDQDGSASGAKQLKAQAGASLARWVTPLPPRDSATEGQGRKFDDQQQEVRKGCTTTR